MFYSKYILAKTGPLGRIWLAAHWDKKLTKQHVFQTDINKTVDTIVEDFKNNEEVASSQENLGSENALALRTSGHLLLGVVRIYSRKTQYLYVDASDALTKIKTAFRSGNVDMPEKEQVAKESSITMKEAKAPNNKKSITNNNGDLAIDDLDDIDKLLQHAELNDYEDLYNNYTAHKNDITLEQDTTMEAPERPRRADISTQDDLGDLDLGGTAKDAASASNDIDDFGDMMNGEEDLMSQMENLLNEGGEDDKPAEEEGMAGFGDFGDAGFGDAMDELDQLKDDTDVNLELSKVDVSDVEDKEVIEEKDDKKDEAEEVENQNDKEESDEELASTQMQNITEAVRPEKRVATQRRARNSAKRMCIDDKLDLADYSKMGNKSSSLRPTHGHQSKKMKLDVEKMFRLKTMTRLPFELVVIIEKNKNPKEIYPERPPDIEESEDEMDTSKAIREKYDTTDSIIMDETIDLPEGEKSWDVNPDEDGNHGFMASSPANDIEFNPLSPSFNDIEKEEFMEGFSPTNESGDDDNEVLKLGSEKEKNDKVMEIINNKLIETKSDRCVFDEIVHGQSRRVAAAYFFEVLTLGQNRRVLIEQDKPFDNITVIKR